MHVQIHDPPNSKHIIPACVQCAIQPYSYTYYKFRSPSFYTYTYTFVFSIGRLYEDRIAVYSLLIRILRALKGITCNLCIHRASRSALIYTYSHTHSHTSARAYLYTRYPYITGHRHRNDKNRIVKLKGEVLIVPSLQLRIASLQFSAIVPSKYS